MNISLSAKRFTYFYRQNNGCGIADLHVWLSCSVDKDFDSKILTTKVRVSSDGTCYWIPPGLFQSSCAMDISYFPFDEQICSLKFGSWMYNGFQLNMHLREFNIDISDYIASNIWFLSGRSTVLTTYANGITFYHGTSKHNIVKRERWGSVWFMAIFNEITENECVNERRPLSKRQRS